jgi:hypothetical protein
MLISLTSCVHGTPEKNDKRVLLSPDVYVWSVLTEEDKKRPLGDFEGADILTSKTMRQIKDHNDKAISD